MMKKPSIPRWRRWHRNFGLISALAFFLWALSGLMHPLMSRLQTQPLVTAPPKTLIDLRQAIAPGQVLQTHRIERINGFNVVPHAPTPSTVATYRVVTTLDQPPRHFDVHSGAEIPNADQTYAQALAQRYFAAHRVVAARWVTRFDNDYARINRYLPVWEIELDTPDRLKVYVETEQGRLATSSHQGQAAVRTFFNLAHRWTFLESWPRLRLLLISAMLAACLVSCATGLTHLIKGRATATLRLRQRPVARWHRRLAAPLVLIIVASVGSGLYHLWDDAPTALFSSADATQKKPRQNSHPLTCTLTPQSACTTLLTGPLWQLLTTQPLQGLSLIQYLDKPALYVKTENNPSWAMDTQGQRHTPFDIAQTLAQQNHASSGAARSTQSTITDVRWINQFDQDYGFVQKRLPVVRVSLSAQSAHITRYYIEPSTATIAHIATPTRSTESWVFSNFHKWHFVEDKDWRDGLLSAAMALVVGLSVLGLALWRQSLGRRSRTIK